MRTGVAIQKTDLHDECRHATDRLRERQPLNRPLHLRPHHARTLFFILGLEKVGLDHAHSFTARLCAHVMVMMYVETYEMSF